jgi:hypothetical protein
VHFQPEADVLADGHVGEQGVALEDHTDVALIGRHGGDVLAVQRDRPGGGRLEAGDHPQGSGLAAAARAEERNEFPLFDSQFEILDGDPAAE